MAPIANPPNVVDLTGEDSDIELDETSISPFHSDLLKKFKARSVAAAEKRQPIASQPFISQDVQRPGPSIPLAAQNSLTTAGPLDIQASLPQNSNVSREPLAAKPPLSQPNSMIRKESFAANSSSSLTFKSPTPSLKPISNSSSRAADIALANDSRKRSAEEAFKVEQGPVSAHQRTPVQSFSFAPLGAKIAKISKAKDVKGRSGFEDLLSRAEASVTAGQGSPSDISKASHRLPLSSKKCIPVSRQGTPPSAVGSLGQSFLSPKAFSSFGEQVTTSSPTKSPPPLTSSPKVFAPSALERASIGPAMRIVPISEVKVADQSPTRPGQLQNQSSRFTSSTTISSPRQIQSTAFPATGPSAQRPYQSSAGIPMIGPSQDSHPSSFAQQTPAQFSHPPAHVSHSAFNSSNMPIRQGKPFTDAELVLLVFLKEELNVSGAEWDRKMGRNTNSCATRYYRQVIGVKYCKPDLKYRERAAFIKAILASMPTATINTVFRLLNDFISSGSIPSAYSSLYETILGTSDLDKIPDFPRKSASASQPVLAVSEPVHSRLRPGARTNKGDMNLWAMTRKVHDTPEVSSDEMSVILDDVYEDHSDMGTVTLPRKEYPQGCLVRRKKPYLGRTERRMLVSSMKIVEWEDEDWSGTSLHLDAEEGELVLLQQYANEVFKSTTNKPKSLESALRKASHAQISDIGYRAKLSQHFRDRTRKSILAILKDASTGDLRRTPMRLRIAPAQRLPSGIPSSSRLLRRELGGAKIASRSIRQTMHDSIAPSRSWTEASGDVGTVAWSPNGIHFAAGSMCIVDPSSMQYNRPNNLLFGNTQHQTLYELPEHHRAREKPAEGANSSHSMHVSQDPRLFFTVSMVDFSRDGSHMFSVGYDNFLRSYEVGNGRCIQKWAVDYGVEVDLLATSRHLDLLATGSRDIESGIRVYSANGADQLLAKFGSAKAGTFLDRKVHPSALRWGTHTLVQHYLLAGFASTAGDETYVSTHGETCLWDVDRQTPISVTPSAGNIFDVAWSPRSARFATACQAYSNSKARTTHSVIRICSPVDMDTWNNRGLELECPARDINDVIFCPFDENYVAAGATDSKVYIWDLRRPDKLLQRFSHGDPLAELDPNQRQEDADCGVRFCGWGENRERLVSGSSDGIVKVWDIYRAPRDAHIRDLASFHSGIMSGAFNHDFSGLLIGEVNGTVNLLEVGVETPDLLKNLDAFHFEPAAAVEMNTDPSPSTLDKEGGKYIGKRLRKAKKIAFKPMGGWPFKQAVQGKDYDGPYDNGPDADELRKAATAFQAKHVDDAIDENVKDPNVEHWKLPRKDFIATYEEAGESGRGVDRIPQSLRNAAIWGLEGHNAKVGKMVAGMLRCSHCGGSARPRIGDKDQEEFPLCERCGFACFRCGERVKVGLDMKTIGCARCGLDWRIGALGYEVVRSLASSGSKKEPMKDVPSVQHLDPLEHTLLGLKAGKTNEGGLEGMGDLLYLVEDYYHGLWEDRPSESL